MTGRPYTDALCPLPGCGSILWITWHQTRPVFTDDATADLSNPEGAYTSSWEIGCEEGHTVLLPLDGNETEVFGGGREDDDGRPSDLERLQTLIDGVRP